MKNETFCKYNQLIFGKSNSKNFPGTSATFFGDVWQISINCKLLPWIFTISTRWHLTIFGTKPYFFYPTTNKVFTAQLVHIAYSLNWVIGWLITDTYWHVLTRTYTYWQLTLSDTYWQPTITRSPKLQKGTRLQDMTKSETKKRLIVFHHSTYQSNWLLFL